MKKTLCVMALIFFGASVINATSFQNGSFEMLSEEFSGEDSSNVFTGWNILYGNIDYVHDKYWEASDGNYSLDLSGWEPSAISQSFDRILGQLYIVQFDLAGNPEGLPRDKLMSVNVGWSGAVQRYTFTTGSELHPISDMGWQEHSYNFTAIDTTTTLKFSSLVGTAYGPALDNVRVYGANPIPEPVTMILLGSGLTALVGFRLRKKKK